MSFLNIKSKSIVYIFVVMIFVFIITCILVVLYDSIKDGEKDERGVSELSISNDQVDFDQSRSNLPMRQDDIDDRVSEGERTKDELDEIGYLLDSIILAVENQNSDHLYQLLAE